MDAKSDAEPEERVVGVAERCGKSQTFGDRSSRDVVCGE